MSMNISQEWQDLLEHMTATDRRAFLRVLLRLRVFCPRCPVKSRGLHLDPCYGCIILPDDRGRPMTTVN